MNTTRSLEETVAQLDSLPAMPEIAQEILALPLDTPEGERDLLALIGTDPQISAKVIGLANAPMFGTTRQVVSISDAAIRLGLNRIKTLALGIAVTSTMTRRPAGVFNAHELWLHSIATALTMRTIAHAMPASGRPNDDELFFTGLLHDIGYMVLDQIDPQLSDAFHQRIAAEPERAAAAIEAEMLALNHGELGAALARHWNLPEHIITTLRYHHHPDDPNATAGQPLVTLVNLAEKLLPTFGIDGSPSQEIIDAEWQALDIDPAAAGDIVAEAKEHASQVAASFG